jgi:hypothetical protein
VVTVLANQIAPGLIDKPADAPDKLFEPVPGPYGTHGRFDSRHPRTGSWEMGVSRHRAVFWATVAIGMVAGVHLLARHLKI